jgi:hypothetical protein
MDLVPGEGNLIQQGLPGHPGVAPGIIQGHTPLISPKNVHLCPRHLVPPGRFGEQFISPPGGLPAGEGHGESAPGRHRPAGLPQETIRRSLTQSFQVRKDLDQACTMVTRQIAVSSWHWRKVGSIQLRPS